jgi:hypothetical protein
MSLNKKKNPFNEERNIVVRKTTEHLRNSQTPTK